MKIERMNVSSLKAFFGKLIKTSFFDLGIEKEYHVASYLTDLLAEFARTDRLYKIRDAEGRKIQSVVEMIINNQGESQEKPDWEREVRKQIGDFTLFISGIFRDHVIRGSHLNYYINEGTKSYYLVSKFDLEKGEGDPLVFSKLSRGFEYYSGALDYMRRVYFKPGKSEDPFSFYVHQISRMKH